MVLFPSKDQQPTVSEKLLYPVSSNDQSYQQQQQQSSQFQAHHNHQQEYQLHQHQHQYQQQPQQQQQDNERSPSNQSNYASVKHLEAHHKKQLLHHKISPTNSNSSPSNYGRFKYGNLDPNRFDVLVDNSFKQKDYTDYAQNGMGN